MTLLLALLAIFLATTEIGFLLGSRTKDARDSAAKSHIDSMQTAVLGLLALLIGFTFFMAVSRLDTRKALLVQEANAIGTAFLRSKFLPDDQRAMARTLLQQHVAARLAFYSAGNDTERLAAANKTAVDIERRLWAVALDGAALDPRSVPAGLFIESLNDVIDLHEMRQVAFENHVPEPVLYLLIGVSSVSFVFLGYGCGLPQRRRFISNGIFALAIALVLTTTLDIDRPRRGFVTVSQESLVRLQASLAFDEQKDAL